MIRTSILRTPRASSQKPAVSRKYHVGSITKPIDLLLEVIDMSADLIALIHEETELKKHHRAYLHVHEELEDCADRWQSVCRRFSTRPLTV